MSFEKIRRLRVSVNNMIKGNSQEIKIQPKQENIPDKGLNLMFPLIVSYYSDSSDSKYYENFAKALIKKCKDFNLDHDIGNLESRGNYGVNCLMKPEFILGKIKEYQKPLIWMDCDTDFKEPFTQFNNVREDIGMATHSGGLDGIKASPLYFNYSKGAFRIIREWVVHCRACYDKGITELDHDALKHYVLDAIKGTYSTFLLSDNWIDFVHGRYISNGNSRVEGKIQIHRKMGVSDEVRRSYSEDIRCVKVLFESDNAESFKSALNFLDKFSNRLRINFFFSEKLLKESINNKEFSRLDIESGGLVFFNELDFHSTLAGKSDIILGIKNVYDIEDGWDLKINSMVDEEENPLHLLNFYDGGKGSIKIKTYKKLWI